MLALAFVMMAGLKAQTVQETTIQYGDFTVPAFTLTVTQEQDIVVEALNQRLKESSVKSTKTSGYIAVLNQTFDAIYAQPVDFYAKVEEQGKKKDRVTVVTFFAKSPNLTISQNELNNNVRTFAEAFPRYVTKFEAQMKVGAEQKNLEKAQKNQAKAAAAVEKIGKSIASDMEKIEKKEGRYSQIPAENRRLQQGNREAASQHREEQVENGQRTAESQRGRRSRQVVGKRPEPLPAGSGQLITLIKQKRSQKSKHKNTRTRDSRKKRLSFFDRELYELNEYIFYDLTIFVLQAKRELNELL